MTKLKSFILLLLAVLLFPVNRAGATNDLHLSFVRTGTDASTVKVKVVDEKGVAVPGATANVESSHKFRSTAGDVSKAILCPNVNGRERPTLKLTFDINHLPKDFRFNNIGLEVHALSAANRYVRNEDGHHRQFNVEARITTEPAPEPELFGSLKNIDIAAGVSTNGKVYRTWSIANEQTKEPGNQVKVELTITAGEKNEGCFFGLSGLVLSLSDGEEPGPEPELTAGIYTIQWKNTSNLYMTETAGHMEVAEYDVAQRMFWELIPATRKGCFYVRNTSNGHYMGSCHQVADASSIVKTVSEPVEYYIGRTASQNGAIEGCYYFSSIDCPNFDQESTGPLALNKDGQSQRVITWQAGSSRPGSYWKLEKSEDLYEIRPFMLSDAVGSPRYLYNITSSKGLALAMDGAGKLMWQQQNGKKSQNWYFVGNGNQGGGYVLVNAEGDQTLNSSSAPESRWYVLSNPKGMGYLLRPYEKKNDAKANLSVEGDSIVYFYRIHSEFARNYQVYGLPCGTLGSQYVVRARIFGDMVKPMQYPLSLLNGGEMVLPEAPRPNSWYDFFTQDQATVVAGGTFNMSITLNTAPLEGQEGFLYLDWDQDGIFETFHQVNLQKETLVELTVPENVKAGKTRLRFRLTENGMTGAEDEVIGQTMDWVVNVVKEIPQHPTLKVEINDPNRGTVSCDTSNDRNCRVLAKAYGDAQFVCWREGRNILSLDEDYSFELTHPTTLVACFSPNTGDPVTGIEDNLSVSNHIVEVDAENQQIKVKTAEQLVKVMVFTTTGRLVAESNQTVVNLNGMRDSVYIVKVFTDRSDKTVKILLNK